MRDNMHDWVVANENLARVLAAKGYHYQFVFSRNAGHCDRATKLQTLPAALEWLWRGVCRFMKIADARVTVVGTPWRELVFLELGDRLRPDRRVGSAGW